MKALAPLSWIYSGAGALRRQAYDLGLLATHKVEVPVISVGSLSPGGSGKTPATRLLATRLLARGLRVGVVTSGYGGELRGTVSRVKVPIGVHHLGLREVSAFGDETSMLANWLQEAVVVCGRDRVKAARRAVSHGAQVIVVDDGFQHRRLERDLDLLMVDAQDDQRRSALQREPPAAARLAHLQWCHRRDGRAPAAAEAHDVASRNVARALLDRDGCEVGSAADLAGQRVFLLAGVARPHAFETLVGDLGARIVGRCFVGDHRPLRSRHLRRAARCRPDLLLCTEKDAVRMSGSDLALDLVALTCDVLLTAGQRRLDLALDQLF